MKATTFACLLFLFGCISCKKEINAPKKASLKKGVYIIGDEPGSIQYTSDMKTFERITYQSPTFMAARVYFVNDLFYLFDNFNQIFGNQCLFTSEDAITWKGTKNNNPVQHPNSVIPLQGKWVRLMPGVQTSVSADGTTWQSYPTPAHMEKRTWEKYYTKGDTVFMYGGWNQDDYTNFRDTWMSTDGIVWQELLATFPPNTEWPEFSFSSFKGKSYAIASEQTGTGMHGLETRILVSDDGYHWSKVSTTAPAWASIQNHRYNNVLFNYKGKMYLGGGIASEAGPSYHDVWSFDGISWQRESDDISDSFPYGLVQVGDARIVVVE